MTATDEWFRKSINTLSLNGKAERTQEAYTRALRMLCEFYGKPPQDITEPELEAYFLRRKNEDHWSANTMRICYCGIRFYFVKVLARNWQLFNYLRARTESRLPAILWEDEVRAILAHVHTAHNRAFLATVYACGLRLQEALASGSLRYRFGAHDDPRAPRQGCEGPLRAAAAREPGALARALVQPSQSPSAVSRLGAR